MCTHLSIFVEPMFYNKIFRCGDFDVVSIFSLVVQFVQCLFFSSEILLIYLNDLRCFRVLCYVLVLQCGNSPEDCCVFSSKVLQNSTNRNYKIENYTLFTT